MRYDKKLYAYFLELPEIKKYKEELNKSLAPECIAEYLNQYNTSRLNIRREGYPPIKRIYVYSMDYMEMLKILLLFSFFWLPIQVTLILI